MAGAVWGLRAIAQGVGPIAIGALLSFFSSPDHVKIPYVPFLINGAISLGALTVSFWLPRASSAPPHPHPHAAEGAPHSSGGGADGGGASSEGPAAALLKSSSAVWGVEADPEDEAAVRAAEAEHAQRIASASSSAHPALAAAVAGDDTETGHSGGGGVRVGSINDHDYDYAHDGRGGGGGLRGSPRSKFLAAAR